MVTLIWSERWHDESGLKESINLMASVNLWSTPMTPDAFTEVNLLKPSSKAKQRKLVEDGGWADGYGKTGGDVWLASLSSEADTRCSNKIIKYHIVWLMLIKPTQIFILYASMIKQQKYTWF